MDENTLEFLRDLCDLMYKHNMTIGCDIDEGGGTDGIFVSPDNPNTRDKTVVVNNSSHMASIDVAEFILESLDESED